MNWNLLGLTGLFAFIIVSTIFGIGYGLRAMMGYEKAKDNLLDSIKKLESIKEEQNIC